MKGAKLATGATRVSVPAVYFLLMLAVTTHLRDDATAGKRSLPLQKWRAPLCRSL
jgi:hypothetical protein